MSIFEDSILSEVDKRKEALTRIELALFTKRYKISSKDFSIFSVQSISMIYSIWEGFIQQSFQLYISELNSFGLDFNQFCNEIKIFHIENKFKQFNSYPQKRLEKLNFMPIYIYFIL
jgi:hypothetical protein